MDPLTRSRRGGSHREVEEASAVHDPDYQAALGQPEVSGNSGVGSRGAPASGTVPGEASPGTLEMGGAGVLGLPQANPFHSERVKAEVELLRHRPRTLDDDGVRLKVEPDEGALGVPISSFEGEPDYGRMQGSEGGGSQNAPRVARMEPSTEDLASTSASRDSPERLARREPVPPPGGKELCASTSNEDAGRIQPQETHLEAEALHPADDPRVLIPVAGDRLEKLEVLLSQVIDENRQLKRRLEVTERESRSHSSWHSGMAVDQPFSPATFGQRNELSVQRFPNENFPSQVRQIFQGLSPTGDVWFAAVELAASQGVAVFDQAESEAMTLIEAPGSDRRAKAAVLQSAKVIKVDLASGTTELRINSYGTLLHGGYLPGTDWSELLWNRRLRRSVSRAEAGSAGKLGGFVKGAEGRDHLKLGPAVGDEDGLVRTAYGLNLAEFDQGQSWDVESSGRDQGKGYRYFLAFSYAIPSGYVPIDVGKGDDDEYEPSECGELMPSEAPDKGTTGQDFGPGVELESIEEFFALPGGGPVGLKAVTRRVRGKRGEDEGERWHVAEDWVGTSRWVISAFTPMGVSDVTIPQWDTLRDLGFPVDKVKEQLEQGLSLKTCFTEDAESYPVVTSEAEWVVGLPLPIVDDELVEGLEGLHQSVARQCKLLEGELCEFLDATEEVLEITRQLNQAECYSEWLEQCLSLSREGSEVTVRALQSEVPLNSEEPLQDQFLQTRTVGLAEARKELTLWKESAQDEVYSLETTNRAVDRISVKEVDRWAAEGINVVQLPGVTIDVKSAFLYALAYLKDTIEVGIDAELVCMVHGVQVAEAVVPLVQELVENDVVVAHLPGQFQIADLGTKPLPRVRIMQLLELANVRCLALLAALPQVKGQPSGDQLEVQIGGSTEPQNFWDSQVAPVALIRALR
ncbi:hypothetical protein AK812_SmicGene43063 [Symbiodinium microadriaticum]|uniref:Uncharacterized protein n=1 Tax=Symbiodinium microadriaticum TaxID=2951 RepID=A0A1Q9C1Z7_SYMMI|nr:hypothetical protein AK812_SmicGene43063 [Symbiodinium microadriaticum]